MNCDEQHALVGIVDNGFYLCMTEHFDLDLPIVQNIVSFCDQIGMIIQIE